MSDVPQGRGWWQASDGRWYPPHLQPDWATHGGRPEDPSTGSREGLPPQTYAHWGPPPQYAANERGPRDADIWLPGSALGQTFPGSPPQGISRPKSRRTQLAILLAVVVVLLAGGTGFALTRTPAPSLSGKSAAQILHLSLAAANKSGAVTVLSPNPFGDPTTMRTYAGANGAEVSLNQAGLGLAFLMTGGHTYLKESGVLFS
ncbi:MAG TPA: hypothetical protein VGP46_08140, partial [Acidimicrobiales bacterium]|nr:hypothetical protein [Acidimicrobiales bacterium]